MKYLILLLFASCAVQPKVATPKIAKIDSCCNGYVVKCWYRDGWYAAHVDTLPPGWIKGKRVTLTTQFRQVNVKRSL